jgi:hypothetical protein
MPRPRFTLKAMFVIVAVLAVPLGMFASDTPGLFFVGYFALFVGGGGSLGYLLGGLKHIYLGMALGVIVAFTLPWLLGLGFWLYDVFR